MYSLKINANANRFGATKESESSFLAEYLSGFRVPCNNVCLGISTGIVICRRFCQFSNESAQTSPLERRPVRSRFERKGGSTSWTGHAWQIRTKRLVGDQGALPKIERTSRTLSLDGVEVSLNLCRCNSHIIAELPPLDLPLSGERYARNLLASALIETLGVAFQRFLQAPFSFSIQHGQRTIMMRCIRRWGSERRRYATCK